MQRVKSLFEYVRNKWKAVSIRKSPETLVGLLLFEFIVIVLAISAGFYADRRAQECKDKVTEISLLQELKGNLTQNIENIEWNYNEEVKAVERVCKIFYSLNGENIVPDSLLRAYKDIVWLDKIELQSSAYFKLNSIGLNIIKNDGLRTEIIDLYEAGYPELIEKTFTTSNIQRELMLPEIYKRFSYDLETKNYFPNNYTKLVEDIEFKNLVSFSIEWKYWRIGDEEESIRATNKVIKLIEKELKSNGVKEVTDKSKN